MLLRLILSLFLLFSFGACTDDAEETAVEETAVEETAAVDKCATDNGGCGDSTFYAFTNNKGTDPWLGNDQKQIPTRRGCPAAGDPCVGKGQIPTGCICCQGYIEPGPVCSAGLVECTKNAHCRSDYKCRDKKCVRRHR